MLPIFRTNDFGKRDAVTVRKWFGQTKSFAIPLFIQSDKKFQKKKKWRYCVRFQRFYTTPACCFHNKRAVTCSIIIMIRITYTSNRNGRIFTKYYRLQSLLYPWYYFISIYKKKKKLIQSSTKADEITKVEQYSFGMIKFASTQNKIPSDIKNLNIILLF